MTQVSQEARHGWSRTEIDAILQQAPQGSLEESVGAVCGIRDRLATPLWGVYKSPRGFAPWRRMLSALSTRAALELMRRDGKLIDAIAREDAFCWSGKVALAAMDDPCVPVRFLSQEIAESFLRTDLPALKTCPPTALPVFVIALPEGLFRNEDGASFDAIAVRVLQEYGVGSAIVGWPLMGSTGKVIGYTRWVFDESGEALEIEDEYCDPASEPIYEQMRRIIGHVVLVMAHRPDLITEEAPLPPSGRGFARRNDGPGPRSVIWIGKDFKPRSRARTAADDQDGAPVATHWRRGHWHTVRHGSKREERRLQWYEPILVNAAA